MVRRKELIISDIILKTKKKIDTIKSYCWHLFSCFQNIVYFSVKFFCIYRVILGNGNGSLGSGGGGGGGGGGVVTDEEEVAEAVLPTCSNSSST